MSSIIRATTTSGLQIAPDNSGSLILQTNGTTAAVTVDTSQNTTFAGKVTSAGALTLASNGTTTAVTIDTSQNVGIGTTSPARKLHVSASVDEVARFESSSNPYISWYSGATRRGYIQLDSSSTAFYNEYAAPMLFGTNSAERMRIDSSGNVLIGNTSFTSLGYLNVQSATTKDGAVFQSSGTGDTTQILFRNPNGVIGKISTLNSATSYVTSSDYRLKENVVPMTGALDKVAQLKPVTYTWKQDGSDGQGFIAHELQAVVPDAVVGEKDAVDEDGNPKYQGIDTSFLVATLTAAIQEQQTIINDLKARVETLEAK